MPTREEILSIVENILKQTEGDSSALECWQQTEDGQKVIQYVFQIGKYNTVIGEGKNITIGDQLDRLLLEEIRDLLLPSPPLDIEAVDMLSSIGIGNETAIQEFIRMLRTKNNYDIYLMALENLENIGIGDETAIHAIFQFLIKAPSHTSFRSLAVNTLNKIIIRDENENANPALSQFIKHYSQYIKANLDVQEVYEVMMISADIISYKDFWQAFNSSSSILWMFSRTSHFLDNLQKLRLHL